MEIKLNSIVVYRNPNPDEIWNGSPLRFVVVEMNGDRCFIEPVTSALYILPRALAMVAELIDVNEITD
jgi:hypothetical protein